MCGIAGFHLSGSPIFRRAQLGLCAKTITHRGPDYTGFYAQDEVYLTHTRLKIVDLSENSNQPFSYNNGQVIISFNGEIYNHISLRNTLKKEGYIFQTHGDVEVLAAAYLYWGNDFVKHIEGMFAIAINDRKEHKILLVRDIFGQKPLYYSLKQGFVFGSELGVFQVLFDDLRLNLEGINHFLSVGYILDPISPYEDIFLLPPASMLEYDLHTNHATISSYYCYADTFRVKHQLSFDDASRQVSHLLLKAVEKRLVGDVPMGIFLSSGLDSSGIAGICKTLNVYPPCFKIAFENSIYDESRSAAEFCAGLNLPYQRIELSKVSQEQLNSYFDSRDYLTFDNSSFPIFKLAQRAKKDVDFVLTGDGSDEIFGGYSTYHADKYNMMIKHIIPLLHFIGLGNPFKTSNDKVGWKTKVARFTKGMSTCPAQAHYNWRLIFNQEERVAILGESNRELVYDTAPFYTFNKLYAEVSDLEWRDRHMFVDSRTWLTNNNLIKLDRNTMAHGLEARSPFLDIDLVKFAAACRVELKCDKQLLKAALQNILPPSIIKRPKSGFNAPVGHWFSSDEDEFQLYTLKLFHYKFR